jgi:hypothetical protein
LIRGASPSTVTVTVLPNVDHAHGLAEAPKPDDGHGRLPLPNAARRCAGLAAPSPHMRAAPAPSLNA